MARPVHMIRYANRKQTMAQWAAESGVPYSTLYARIKRLGWTMKQALSTPVRPKL